MKPLAALGFRAICLALTAAVFVLAQAAPPVAAQTTERVSVASSGTQGNGTSGPTAISADGRFVAFTSRASNLVPGDTNGASDVFVHDRETGVTTRVSVASNGTQGNADSGSFLIIEGFGGIPSIFGGSLAISADGRFVAFQSGASNLLPGDTNGVDDIFVHDRETGETERVSVASNGTQGNLQSLFPAISADGRFVAFRSDATNLVPGDTNGTFDVFVHDRETGVTERVSVASGGTQGNGASAWPAISADGRFVAFHSLATNLVPGDTNGRTDIFVRDRETGVTELVSVASDGTKGNFQSFFPAISADGRFVAFQSAANNLVPGDTNIADDVFVHDRETRVTELVSVGLAGTPGSASSEQAAISAGGRFVAFVSFASNLVPGDTNNSSDFFVRDRLTRVTERVSVTSDGSQGNLSRLTGGLFFHQAAISAGGRFVAFESGASNLVPGDTNGVNDVFVRDRGGAEEPPPPADGVIGPAGGTVEDTAGTGASITIPAGVLTVSTTVTIEVSDVSAFLLPEGFSAFGTLGVDITLDPNPGSIDATITLPLAFPLPPGTRLSLVKVIERDFSLAILQLGITGTVDPGGATATFSGVIPGFSIFVGLQPANQPPVADAGPDQSIIEIGTVVQLDGTGSFDDEDGDVTGYEWSFVSVPPGSAAALDDPASATPTFVADVRGDYVIQLVATDSQGAASAPDTVAVSFDNLPPVADAGENQAVLVGAEVVLDGTASTDPNLDPLTYHWSLVSLPEGSLAALSDPASPTPFFTADVAGTYVAQLIVNDGDLDSGPATATIVASPLQDGLFETLQQLVDTINTLDDGAFKNANMRNALTNKLNAVLAMIDEGRFEEAVDKLQNDVLAKTNGCAEGGAPDKNDWIRTCGAQDLVYGLVVELIGMVAALM